MCAGVYFWGRNEGWDKKRPINTGELTPNTIPYPTVLVHRKENPRQPHQLLSMKHSELSLWHLQVSFSKWEASAPDRGGSRGFPLLGW